MLTFHILNPPNSNTKGNSKWHYSSSDKDSCGRWVLEWPKTTFVHRNVWTGGPEAAISPALTTTPLPCSLGVEGLPSWPSENDGPAPHGCGEPTHSLSPAKPISNRPWDRAGAHRPHYPGSPETQVGAIRSPTPEILELGVRDTWTQNLKSDGIRAAIFCLVPGKEKRPSYSNRGP